MHASPSPASSPGPATTHASVTGPGTTHVGSGGASFVAHPAVGPTAYGAAATPVTATSATGATGAYDLTGDPMIDRMIQLEAACKRFGPLV